MWFKKKNIKKLLGEALELCVEISQKTKHDAWIAYAGHVDSLSISYQLGGYAEGAFPNVICNVYLDKDKEATTKELVEAIKKLKALLKGGYYGK